MGGLHGEGGTVSLQNEPAGVDAHPSLSSKCCAGPRARARPRVTDSKTFYFVRVGKGNILNHSSRND